MNYKSIEMNSFLVRTGFLKKYFRVFMQFQKLFSEGVVVENSDFYRANRPHIPVMVKEVIENLNLKDGDKFLDMTFGAGGHSEALLERYPSLQVFALDRDPVARQFADDLKVKYPDQIIFLEGKFSDLSDLLKNFKENKSGFDGMLFDLGCSSMQFDCPDRGFASNREGPLDMRMDGDRIADQLTAADVIAYVEERSLIKILKEYGGEKNAVKIARAIVAARAEFESLKTTKQLVELIETVLKGVVRRDKLHRRTNVATKVFLALRMFVNNEINELHQGLLLAHRHLKPGGRAVALTFNSTEDKVVKRHFQNTPVDSCLNPLPLIYVNPCRTFLNEELSDLKKKNWEPIAKKFILPTSEEVNRNARARSAKLRAATKI